ncbi:MAG: IS481 family transposase [Gemmatimonadaceae bacterium]
MPWLETSPMEQRSRFIDAYLAGGFTMTELCARYQISRRVGYKWIARYDADGRKGLADRSRAPHQCPHKVSDEIAALLCGARRKHPDWGPEKLIAWLKPQYPRMAWPAISTASDLLKRAGLVHAKRRRYRATHPGVGAATTQAPNDLWTADFKGHFRTGDGEYCYPLTVADQHTRYLLACHALRSTQTHGVTAHFEHLFREFGVPRAIRTDNGVPFATTGLHGLSRLSVWWIWLGIVPQRILPGQPQQNGAHERMHRTLKRAAIRPPCRTFGTQQRAFDRFRHEYNTERPHQHLDGATPSAHHHPSPRPYPAILPAITYPSDFVVKEVTAAGTFRLGQKIYFLSNSLIHYPVGLEEHADGIWSVYFCHVLLARLDEKTATLTRG